MKFRLDRRQAAPAAAEDDTQLGPVGVEGEMSGAGALPTPTNYCPDDDNDDEMLSNDDDSDEEMLYLLASPGTLMFVQQLAAADTQTQPVRPSEHSEGSTRSDRKPHSTGVDVIGFRTSFVGVDTISAHGEVATRCASVSASRRASRVAGRASCVASASCESTCGTQKRKQLRSGMPNERSVKLPRELRPANVEAEEDDLVPLLNFIEQEELLRDELMECADETVRIFAALGGQRVGYKRKRRQAMQRMVAEASAPRVTKALKLMPSLELVPGFALTQWHNHCN